MRVAERVALLRLDEHAGAAGLFAVQHGLLPDPPAKIGRMPDDRPISAV